MASQQLNAFVTCMFQNSWWSSVREWKKDTLLLLLMVPFRFIIILIYIEFSRYYNCIHCPIAVNTHVSMVQSFNIFLFLFFFGHRSNFQLNIRFIYLKVDVLFGFAIKKKFHVPYGCSVNVIYLILFCGSLSFTKTFEWKMKKTNKMYRKWE